MTRDFSKRLWIKVLILLATAWIMSGGDANAQSRPANTETPASAEPVKTTSETDPAPPQPPGKCLRTVVANIGALDQPFMLNRLGASMPQGEVFALMSDIVPNTGTTKESCDRKPCQAGKVMIRGSKRPRPIVLRVNQGDCLQINFTNLLTPTPSTTDPIQQLLPATRSAGVHIVGMQMVNNVSDDASNVGANATSLAQPGKQKQYVVYAGHEGNFLLYSTGADFGSAPNSGNALTGGQLTNGLFGSINVEAANKNPQAGPVFEAEWYRSQVTAEDLYYATKGLAWTLDGAGNPVKPSGTAQKTQEGQPIIEYNAIYPPDYTYPDGTKVPVGTPILRMVDRTNKLVHSDLTAIITGPGAGNFPKDSNLPEFAEVSASPERWQPFREFTIHYHDLINPVQAFTDFYSPTMSATLTPATDLFAINYGTGGIGSEILANRYAIGPEARCAECRFEEFFLSSWSVGDPAMVVDRPANIPSAKTPPYNTKDVPNVASALTKALTQTSEGATPSPAIGPPGTPNKVGVPNVPLQKASMAFYPDDPSNVYHSYLSDHVKFRITHAGSQLTHVHHQHAHQWLHSPNDDGGSYLDSQMISPGASYTLEMVYNGSGNRNKTVGDSIFHCHFYPHFAAGMWGMWRVHDVFEEGTCLNKDGHVVSAGGTQVSPCLAQASGGYQAGAQIWNRALPDGEIASGTPIPAIVPLPTLAMAPIPPDVRIIEARNPADGNRLVGYKAEVKKEPNGTYENPGYPFFIPGVGGHRPPQPPMDFAYETTPGGKVYLNGGLPRNLIIAGSVDNEEHNQWDFNKENHSLFAFELPELGTPLEQAAMAFNSVRTHPSFTPDNKPAGYLTNGLPRKPSKGFEAENQFGSQAGAPFADPAMLTDGAPFGTKRVYKAADIQTDVVFSKEGWHYPQERFLTLWGDVEATINQTRGPEPLFFRANSTEFIEYWLTNLVPNVYELDDFQVRTPTDILGQHIHLVKFDVLASDGAANGFNYEDGTLSPDEVRDRIAAIQKNSSKGIYGFDPNTQWMNPYQQTPLAPKNPPKEIYGNLPPRYWDCNHKLQNGQADPGKWCGAQTTVQRWFADPLMQSGKDRTLTTVFTHDHFGPSTHQQAGLYAGLLVEPEQSKWFDSVTGQQMGTRSDGGPTSWAADILTAQSAQSYREFALEFQDLALGYLSASKTAPVPYKPYASGSTISSTQKPWGWVDCANSVNPPARCSGTAGPGAALPQIISGNVGIGTNAVNYRNEPLPFRVTPPSSGTAPKNATDLSYVFASIQRVDQNLNCQPKGPLNQTVNCQPVSPPPTKSPFSYPGGFPGAQPFDPYTPLLRAYQNDRVQVRVLVGAHLLPHGFGMHGVKWLFEPFNSNSGYRDNHEMGISEHFEFHFTVPPTTKPSNAPQTGPFSADYLYMPGMGADQDLTTGGLWGLLRAYNGENGTKLLSDLKPLPNNPGGGNVLPPNSVCPAGQPINRAYDVSAITAQQILPGGQLIYNNRLAGNPVFNPAGFIYVFTDDLDLSNPSSPKLKQPGVQPEPVVLRAAAGECVQVTLRNLATGTESVFAANQGMSPAGNTQSINMFVSSTVGLHPQLLSVDVIRDDGANVGQNPSSMPGPNQSTHFQTVGPGQMTTYYWYAGNISVNGSGSVDRTPVELGSANLLNSDPLFQQTAALIGAVIVEPKSSVWCTPNKASCSNTQVGNIFTTVRGVSADVWGTATPSGDPLFREFVAIIQDNNNLSYNVPGKSGMNSQGSINYGSEPMPYRYQLTSTQLAKNKPLWNSIDLSEATSNCLVDSDPKTPIFQADPGKPVRFRFLKPDGLGGIPDNIITIHGHEWQEEPYVNNSTALGFNRLSQWFGSRDGFGPGNHFDVLIESAGGRFGIQGDYLYRTFPPGNNDNFSGGIWGIFRVGKPPAANCAEQPTARAYRAPARTNAKVVDFSQRFIEPAQLRKMQQGKETPAPKKPAAKKPATKKPAEKQP